MELDFTRENIRQAATAFWKVAGDTSVIAVHGEMGAGKTTFIHALCDSKGIKDPVTSPTFSIINEYDYVENGKQKKIFHLDLYRLKDEEEAMLAGVEDCLYGGDVCFVEWPEKAPGIFPENTLHAYITIVNSASRRLRVDDK
jgi:tRNA threonylcarbamoyladenosine biosynthesis protein TsaE